jgi:purine-binding chemotaxis protein CheW
MSANLPTTQSGTQLAKTSAGGAIEHMYVTMITAGQLFGISVLQVQDVLGPQRITRVPLAPPEVAGSLNLRGRIVTAIDMRVRLGMPPRPEGETGMSVVVELNNELYSLIVDKVGEVMSLPQSDYEGNPSTLEPHWQEVSDGIYRLTDSLLIVLNVAKLLRQDQLNAA